MCPWKPLLNSTAFSTTRRSSVRFSSQLRSFQATIDALAGQWGDDIGLTIRIEGNQAWFSDGTGPWSFEEDGGALALRGARLIGDADAPVWQFPNGVERSWARLQAAGAGNTVWAETLLAYKEERLKLRHQLQVAFAFHDLSKVATLRFAWESSPSLAHLNDEQNRALDTGRKLVTGVCFRHRKFDYRGVILGCDAWCTYPTTWRAMWVPNRPRGEAQPFYYCLVDERDRPGRQSRYVVEENIELSEFVFPVQAELVDALFIRCDQLGGYLPGHTLEQVLRQQQSTGKFSL